MTFDNFCCSKFFIFVGVVSVLLVLCRVLSVIYRKFLRAPKDLFVTYGRPDSWAIVTGSSDGIGRSFCDSLAERGFNICLIARNLEKLEKAKKEIEADYPKIKTAIVIADFSLSAQDPINFYERVLSDLAKQNISDIAILVNNAGSLERGPFIDISLKGLADTLSVNTYPALFLTKLIIPKMLNRTNRSLIINLASLTAVVAVPMRGCYGATKAFNDVLARSLALEFDDKIDIMALKPNYVATKFINMKVGGSVISPRDCVEGCLRDAGYTSTTPGHWKHELMEFLMKEVIPTKILVNIAKKRREKTD